MCLVQGKTIQPKDDSWSDCAKNGYAGIIFEMEPDYSVI
jgi:hypothetical protein